jgi:hypothetical protein
LGYRAGLARLERKRLAAPMCHRWNISLLRHSIPDAVVRLQWWQVKWPQGQKRDMLFLPSTKMKTKQERSIPTNKPLLAVLEMRRHAPDDSERGPNAYVFDNELAVNARTSRTVGAASSTWQRSPSCISMICRETASRWLENGVVQLHEISAWLGTPTFRQQASVGED